MQGFGGKLGDEVEAFAGELTTPTQLTTKYSLAQFSAKFGAECGMWVWRVLHGCDDEPGTALLSLSLLSPLLSLNACVLCVVKTVGAIKSFAASKNLPTTTTVAELPPHVHVVCVELLARLNRDYEQFHRFPQLFGVHYRFRQPNECV